MREGSDKSCACFGACAFAFACASLSLRLRPPIPIPIPIPIPMEREEHTSTSVHSGKTVTGLPPPDSGPSSTVMRSFHSFVSSKVIDPQFKTVAPLPRNVFAMMELLYTFAPGSMIELDIMVLECIPGFKVLVDRFVFVLVVFVLVVFVLVFVLVLVLRVGIAERSIPSITLPEKEQFRICDLICSLTRELSMAHVLLFKFPFPFPSSFPSPLLVLLLCVLALGKNINRTCDHSSHWHPPLIRTAISSDDNGRRVAFTLLDPCCDDGTWIVRLFV